MTDRTPVLFMGQDKEMADILAEYLRRQFTMASDYPPAVERGRAYASAREEQWVVSMPEHCSRYSTTIKKMRLAARDFERGVSYGLTGSWS